MLRRTMLVIFPAFGLLALGQGGRGHGKCQGMACYDRSTEGTFKGTVEEVKEVEHAGMQGKGIHAMMKTDQGVIEIHIGPASFVSKQQFTIEKGDALEVVGSKVKAAGADAVVARTIKKGDKTLTLRSEQGKPLWSGGPPK
jgi:hypothetical protein